MSVHSTFTLEAEAPEKALAALAKELVVADPAPLVDTTRLFGDWWLPKSWEMDKGTLLGPGGWSLIANKKTVTISHILRYNMLNSNNEFGRAVIEGVNFFGSRFGAGSAIFCHEMLSVPDVSLVEGAKGLSKQFAEARTWDEAQNACFEDGCWIFVSLPIPVESS